MSGKRHHFIPRFLQSGFASHDNSNEIFTWVYRKGAQPFNTNIVNVGVEGYFYSQDGNNQLDDKITAAENDRFVTIIDSLRNSGEGAVEYSSTLVELIAHLEIRTRQLRQNFSSTIGILTEEILRFLEDEQAFSNYLTRRMRCDPSFMRDALINELKKYGVSEAFLPQLLVTIQPQLEQMLPALAADMRPMIDVFRAGLPDMLKIALKSGHIKALTHTLAPPIKIEQYSKLKYSLFRHTTVPLPLGDSMLVFQLNEKRIFKPFCEKDDQVKAIYLPLSPSIILVGNIDDSLPDLSKLPMAIAQCSLEFFISNSKSSDHDDLHTHIGECSYLLSQDQIEALLANIFKLDTS